MAGRTNVTDAVKPKVMVGLDFGTAFSGFAYAHMTEKDKIQTFYAYPSVGRVLPYCKTLTGSYYKRQSDAPGGWKLQSWGYPARSELEKDFREALKQQQAGPSDDPFQPVLGIYLCRFKLHLLKRMTEPSSATTFPGGLTVGRVITDYLREIGGFVLTVLQRNYGSTLAKNEIQWCVTVPSIWDNAAKEQMRTCMINAELVDGVDGSPHPLIIVLEPEAASFHCHRVMNQMLKVGDRLLVADIGGGTADIVVQEVVSEGENYRVKQVTKSSGGLCGGTYVDTKFMDFLHQKIPCLTEYMKKNPNIYSEFIRRWEDIKVSFGEPTTRGESTDIGSLPQKLATEWENYDRRMGLSPRSSYDELEITYTEMMEQIFDPVVDQSLDLISQQLVQASGVKLMVVVGGFAGSCYLMDRIKRHFSDQVPVILSPPNPGSAVCQGAVALALNPQVIVSRVAHLTYGILCSRNFEADVDPLEYREIVEGVAKCNNRFDVYVQTGTDLKIDECVSKILNPVYPGQIKMKFELYSSTETDPRYTTAESVTREGELEIDISEARELGRDRQVRLSLFFGRTSIEAKAEAVNFHSDAVQQALQFPVKLAYL